MQSANVLIVEDYPDMVEIATANLKARGHRVVHVAGSVVEAMTFLAKVASRDPEVDDVHIVLTDGNTEINQDDGAAGEQVAAFTHEHLPGVVVIGWSLDGYVRGADHNIPKHDMPGLGRLIMELPDPETRTGV